MLKNCLTLPKLLYLLRTAPIYQSEKLKTYDDTLKCCLEKILNIQMNETKWLQASLPVRLGGLGIRSIMQISTSAYISSCHKTRNLVDLCSPIDLRKYQSLELRNAEETWRRQFGFLDADQPKDKNRMLQEKWDLPGCKYLLKSLISDSFFESDKARLQAISQEHSSDWLNALPSTNLELKIDMCTLAA